MDLKKLPYSPVRKSLTSGLVFVSGQVGLRDGKLVSGGFEAQMVQAIDNLKRVLKDEGLEMENILKVTAFLTRMEDFATFNRIYSEAFGPKFPNPSSQFPARSTVIASPPLPGALFEIEAIAEYR
jgi:2-iminobutanoate/2-iminopropanoate deaminase